MQRLLVSQTASWQGRLEHERRRHQQLLLQQGAQARQAACLALLGGSLGTGLAAVHAVTQDLQCVTDASRAR